MSVFGVYNRLGAGPAGDTDTEESVAELAVGQGPGLFTSKPMAAASYTMGGVLGPIDMGDTGSVLSQTPGSAVSPVNGNSAAPQARCDDDDDDGDYQEQGGPSLRTELGEMRTELGEVRGFEVGMAIGEARAERNECEELGEDLGEDWGDGDELGLNNGLGNSCGDCDDVEDLGSNLLGNNTDCDDCEDAGDPLLGQFGNSDSCDADGCEDQELSLGDMGTNGDADNDVEFGSGADSQSSVVAWGDTATAPVADPSTDDSANSTWDSNAQSSATATSPDAATTTADATPVPKDPPYSAIGDIDNDGDSDTDDHNVLDG